MNYVYGTADELRRLAALHAEGRPEPLTAAHAEHARRVEAVQARCPGVPLANLAGRVFCDHPTGRAVKHWASIRDQGISADLYLYGAVGEWDINAADFTRDLNAITATDLTLYLNSPGGEVFEGLAIYNKLRDHMARVEVRVDGFAASIASVIAMAGDRVVMNRQARMMIHDASGLVAGNTADMLAMADVLDAVSDDMAAIYAARAGGTPAAWRKQMKAETWFSAEAAVAAGLADEAVSPSKIPAEPVAAVYAPAGQGPDSRAASPGPGPEPDPDPFVHLVAALAALSPTPEMKEAAL